jgi:hypothetical protein
MKPAVKRRFKDALFEEFARVGKAIASPRLELIELLAQGERTVDELASETSQPIANTSQWDRLAHGSFRHSGSANNARNARGNTKLNSRRF